MKQNYISSVRQIMAQCTVEITPEMTTKERAALVTVKLNSAAIEQGILLKM